MLMSLLIPAIAYANMGPPSLLIAWGAFWILVSEIVIVIVEALVLWRILKLTPMRGFGAALAGNVVSTIFGLPLALIAADIDVPVLRGEWFGPFAAVVVTAALIATFFACSFLIEWPIVKLVSRCGWKRSALAVAVANAITHVGLLALALVLQGWG